MIEVTPEHLALAAMIVGFLVEQVLPRCQAVEGNSLSEVCANLLRSQCLRGGPPPPPATIEVPAPIV